MQLITNSPRRSSRVIGRLLWPVIAFVVGVLIMGVVARRSSDIKSSQATQEAKNNITVSAKEGEVDYKRGDTAWQTVTDSTLLEAADAVRIVGKGHLTINLKNLGIVRIGSDTAVSLVEVNDQQLTLQHERGVLYLRLPSEDSHATVRTPAASYAIQGTTAAVYVGDTTDGIMALQSNVTISSDGQDLQSISVGQAYYVATKDEKALRTVMPISDITVATDEFLQWNATQDRDLGISKEDLGILSQVPASEAGAIRLTATTTDKGIVLAWKIEGSLDVSRGFKVLKSESRNPEFPGSSYQSEPQSGARTHTWDIADGQSYHFRVCQYLADGTCGTYSNDVAIAAPSAL